MFHVKQSCMCAYVPRETLLAIVMHVPRETMLFLQFMFHVKRHSTIITVMRCQFSPDSVRHVVL